MFGSEKLKGLIYDSPDSIKSYELGELQELCLENLASDLSSYDIDQIKRKKDIRSKLENGNTVENISWQQMMITKNIRMEGYTNPFECKVKKIEPQEEEEDYR